MQTFYTKLNDEAYFGLPFVSQSYLKHLASLNYAQYLCKTEEMRNRAITDEMRLGTVMHSICLENQGIEALARFKRLDGRTADGKAQKKELTRLRSYIFEDELSTVLEMRDLFKASFSAQALMSKAIYIENYGVAEVYNERNVDNKIFVKFKPDIVGADFMADYKTMWDYASDENIRRSLRTGDYAFQAACYLILDSLLTGKMKQDFYFIFQEAIKPFGVRVIKLDQYSLEQGFDRFDKAIKKYINAINNIEKHSNPNYLEVNEIGSY